ncbi:acyl-CoA thioesterase [Thiohalobacter sp. IOR34]|uniref:acyl-CoA thioesterase n=1 Tax=Thiohalobacter sp. IOR34 TaxID=3057176 RepID=UPI0025B20761|nr:acyl-CoA thioesterase [Thiohalobacter sp. IOR34]WJW75969.1 acyl-CoA thioesterase [Thiohalobacter sp. IOR34]
MTDAPAFSHAITVPLQDVDAAGVVFFAHLFRYAHEAYEAFMAERGQALPALLAAGRLALPVVHAEADYRAPLHHGEQLTMALRVAAIGEHSFTLDYRLLDAANGERARLQTVHAVLDASSRQPCPLPSGLRAALSA